MKKTKEYYHNLYEELPICTQFHDLEEKYDYQVFNISDADIPETRELLKSFVKKAPRFLEPYLWLERIYTRDGKRRSAEAIFKKAYSKAIQMVMGRERQWPDTLSWGSMDNRTIIRIFLRKAEESWYMGRVSQSHFQEAYTIYMNLLKSNPYDQPCVRLNVLAVLEGISSDQFDQLYTEYDKYGEDYFKPEVFDWFEKNGRKHQELKWWFEYAEREGLL
jgi:hypothetical protein